MTRAESHGRLNAVSGHRRIQPEVAAVYWPCATVTARRSTCVRNCGVPPQERAGRVPCGAPGRLWATNRSISTASWPGDRRHELARVELTVNNYVLMTVVQIAGMMTATITAACIASIASLVARPVSSPLTSWSIRCFRPFSSRLSKTRRSRPAPLASETSTTVWGSSSFASAKIASLNRAAWRKAFGRLE